MSLRFPELRRARRTVVVLAALLSSSLSARADHPSRLSVWAGGELTLHPEFGGHGIVDVRWQLDGLPHEGRLIVDYNTDTLRVALDHLRFGRFELGVIVGGEVFIAGLLSDYWRDGRNDGARAFRASWISAGASLKLDLQPSFIELALSARRWFFQRQSGTSALLSLPPEAWVGEWRLRYTRWSLAPDRSLWEAQRPFARLVGVAFGVELGADVRSSTRPWGARDASFSPSDLRNDPSTLVLSARQWLRAGVRLSQRLRLQIEEVALWMSGADDLDRARVGGMNPYVVPMAGAPWAGFIVGRLAAAQLSLHARLWRELEAGVLADGAIVDDVARTGSPLKPGALGGVGAFVDFRLRSWQVDVRAGYCPSVSNAFSIFASLGWGWSR